MSLTCLSPSHSVEDDWLPEFVPPGMRHLTRDTLNRKWAKHVNDLKAVPHGGSICGQFSKEEHRICDLLCIVADIPLKGWKCLSKLPSLEEVEVKLEVYIPIDLKEEWHRARGVPLPDASRVVLEDKTKSANHAVSASAVEEQSSPLSTVEAPSSAEGTNHDDSNVGVSTSQATDAGFTANHSANHERYVADQMLGGLSNRLRRSIVSQRQLQTVPLVEIMFRMTLTRTANIPPLLSERRPRMKRLLSKIHLPSLRMGTTNPQRVRLSKISLGSRPQPRPRLRFGSRSMKPGL